MHKTLLNIALQAILFCTAPQLIAQQDEPQNGKPPKSEQTGQEGGIQVIDLHPVSIISVHPEREQTQQISLDFGDRMAHDAGQLLMEIPLVNGIRKSGNYGFDPVIRGFKNEQINLVMDGMRAPLAACPNRMDPPSSQMAPNMTERIEILKGPYALRFGSAFGATVNFIPQDLRFSHTPRPYGRLSGVYESNGDIFRNEGMLGFSGNNYDATLFGSWSQGGDYQTGNETLVKAHFLRGSFGTQLGYKINDAQQLRIKAIRNYARDSEFAALPMDLTFDDTWIFQARHDIQVNGPRLRSWNTGLFGSLVDHGMDNLKKPIDPRMVNAETIASTYIFGGRTEGEWLLGNANFFTGIDFRSEGAEGTRVREFVMGPNAGKVFRDNAWQDGAISQAGFFGEYRLHRGAWNFVLASRLDINNAKLNDAADEFLNVHPETSFTDYNFSFSAGTTRRFGRFFTAGMWLGRAQRSGSLTERYINFFPVGLDPYELVGTPNIKPETNNQLDLSLGWQKANTAIKVDVFAAYLQDYIGAVIDQDISPRLPASPGVRTFTNFDEVIKAGFEVQWSQKLFSSFSHLFAVAYTYGQNLSLSENLAEIAPLDMRYTLSGNLLNNTLTPKITLRHVMEQRRIAESFGEIQAPSFTLLDASVDYRITTWVSVRLGVNNLFNTNYYEHLSRTIQAQGMPVYAPGRNVFLAVNTRFF